MGNLTDKVKGLTSRRVTKVIDPTPPPTYFAVYGGWASAGEGDAANLSPEESERAQRVAGAVALAELGAEQDARKREERDGGS